MQSNPLHEEAELERQESWCQNCVCGRVFFQPNGFSSHISSCRKYLNRLGSGLKDARVKWQSRHDSQKQGKAAIATWLAEGDNLDFDVDMSSIFDPLARNRDNDPHTAEQGQTISDESKIACPDRNPQASVSEPQAEQPNIGAQSKPAATDGGGRGQRLKKRSVLLEDFLPTSALPFSFPQPEEPSASTSGPPSATQAGTESPGQDAAPRRGSEVIQPETPPRPPLLSKTTPQNAFGVYKCYQTTEQTPHDPDAYVSQTDLQEESAEDFLSLLDRKGLSQPNSDRTSKSPFYPYPNVNTYLIGDYFWSDGNQKSSQGFKRLCSIIERDEFRPGDIRKTDWSAVDRVLSGSEYTGEGKGESPWEKDGSSWMMTDVTIEIPFNRRCKPPGPIPFTIPEFHYRPLIPLMRQKIKTSAEFFHHVPHELRWKPGPTKDERIYCEMYQSDAFLEAYREVQEIPYTSLPCTHPRYIVGLMFASDATMLTSFGDAKVWPCYGFFGNDSKYMRSKPSLNLGEPVAFFEKLPDNFKDFVGKHSGAGKVGKGVLSHCLRELFHAQWKILLDDEFLDAYENGIVVECIDEVERRFFPRILTYSADYPEKVVIAGIKNLGKFPCPSCGIPLDQVHSLGMKRDQKNRVRLARIDSPDQRSILKRARNLIYEKNYSVKSKTFEEILPESMLPTSNAFSDRLAPFGFNYFDMLVSDFLHEVELGVWKATFIQLLRLLDAFQPTLVNELDLRQVLYRLVPTFGKDTIRRFRNNMSEMRQLAGRDFEDLLQCAIPVFDGLIDDKSHARRISKLLYTLAYWHGLAKLRLHTDSTLLILDNLTSELGTVFRDFVDHTCHAVETKELPREYQARKRRQEKKTKTKSAVKKGAKRQKLSHSESDSEETGRKTKTLNLNTFKFHGLGHVVRNIKRFGTSENYSTQTPERYHCFSRAHYRRTSKKKVHFTLARIQMRQTRLRRLRKQLIPERDEGTQDPQRKEKYFIGVSQNNPIDLATFLHANRDDFSTNKFMANMKSHLLPRVRAALLQEAMADPHNYRHAIPLLKQAAKGLGDEQDHADMDRILIHSSRMYRHDLFHINFTTYDMKRDQDILNPKTSRRDFMCLAPPEEDKDEGAEVGAAEEEENEGTTGSTHKFNYGRIIGVYHVNVVFLGKGSLDSRHRRFDILWVRWFSKPLDPEGHSPELDRVELRPFSDPASTSFLDPTHVLRASHLIPRFSKGQIYSATGSAKGSLGKKRKETRGKEPISKIARDKDDWNEYYVNRFVDRDMLMRYHWGLGVGHVYAQPDRPMQPNSPGGPMNGNTGVPTPCVAEESAFACGRGASLDPEGQEEPAEQLEDDPPRPTVKFPDSVLTDEETSESDSSDDDSDMEGSCGFDSDSSVPEAESLCSDEDEE